MHADPWITAQLEAALVRELAKEYVWIARVKFASSLRGALIELSAARSRHGRWIAATRTIEIARSLAFERPWPEVIGVLEHEMAHQYVDEVLAIRDETAHGETFRTVCEQRGIDGRAAGAPVAADHTEADRVLDRIRKLLALAGSSNEHEAEIAMRRAHELMLRHNIEEARARADREFEIRYLGDPEKRRSRVETDVALLLEESFFVKLIRLPVYLPHTGGRGSVFEISGTHANVEMAAHVWAFLLATADRLWQENRRDRRVRSGRDRLSYQSGVIRGFRDKLVAERTELRGTGLVWRPDRALESFYRARHPRITVQSRSVRFDAAHQAGREAGGRVVLHKPVESHGTSRGRLLSG